jgi:oligopeptide/dipeptide ABC transporter ATP-binding protein
MALLEIKNLHVNLKTREASLKLVRNISFSVDSGHILGLVGESGCGKSLTALSILRLVKPPLSISGGQILYNGQDLLQLNKKQIRKIRGCDISMIFQEPMTSLHPLMPIGEQIGETIREHLGVSRKEEKAMVFDLLRTVGINFTENRFHQYPYELSGGMRQRVMIAIALSCKSKLLLADEPTTALDVTIQAQILSLLKRLNQEQNLSIVLISHDLAVVSELCDELIVLYAGEVIESGITQDLLTRPFHPYTKALLEAIPQADRRKKTLFTIPGKIPSPSGQRLGCLFASRCQKRSAICNENHPLLAEVGVDRKVRCLLYGDSEVSHE